MDSVKVWLYAIASMLLAAALAPWLYNLGRALAEVTDGKQTNGIVEWVAEGCRKAGLAIYFKWAWGIAGAVLAVPFIGWRTASLWLPVGLHAGWIFSTRLFQELAKPLQLPAPFARALVGDTLQHGWIPLVALVVAGIVVHFIIPVQEDFEYGGD